MKDRIAEKSATDGECHVWLAATSRGYGVLRVDGKNLLVHRVMCEEANGPSDGRHALHSCNNRKCIRADHLYWGTNADNQRDRQEAGTARGGKCYATHCKWGHEFSDENTYWEPSGRGRGCKECRRQNLRDSRARKKNAHPAS